MAEPLLKVSDLRTHFFTSEGVVKAVDGVSFQLERGKTLGIVGESGCGKSVTSLAIMGLIPDPPGKVVGGTIEFDGENLLTKGEKEMQHVRGNAVSMIFQEPMTSLNPVLTIGDQIVEAVLLHQHVNLAAARQRAVEMLRLVNIPSPEKRLDEYPHELSGGMRQRVMIAMALSCNPKLLIADEPTTALDVTIQAQILNLMRRLRDKIDMSIMLITHDMGVIAEMADDVIVMYAGKIVEQADVTTLFERPRHPYTVGLLGSIPKLNEEAERLFSIEGVVPNPLEMPAGCRFQARCKCSRPICEAEEPPLTELPDAPGQKVACWQYLNYGDRK